MKKQNQTNFDVIIVGGGLVGASLACALASANLKTALQIAIIENFKFDDSKQPSFDSRTVALSYSSKEIFQTLGLWKEIEKRGACAIKEIHISDKGHLGLSHLRAVEQDTDALGYVVENQFLGSALYQQIKNYKNITMLCPCSIKQFTHIDSTTENYMQVEVEQDNQTSLLSTKLLVAADGGQSFVREQAEVKMRELAYNQTAIITNIACNTAHNNIAYERFTDSGPIALLPLEDSAAVQNRYSLVWTLKNYQVEAYMAMSDTEFLAALQLRFGGRAGQFIKTANRVSYPLSYARAKEIVRPRLAIIGNAAHLVHPVAGQGFNLGLRDVASLAQIIVDAQQQQNDFGDVYYLKMYESWRQRDLLQTSLTTDGLIRLFTTRFLPVVVARNMALLAFDMFPVLKKQVGRQAMGFVGKVTRLARGLPL